MALARSWRPNGNDVESGGGRGGQTQTGGTQGSCNRQQPGDRPGHRQERRASFTDIDEAGYDFVLNTNLKGAFFTAQTFVKHLLERKAPGRIVNISSVHEELPFPHFTTYCASKGGLKMMMRNLAIELAPYGIAVNNIAPGAIETPINRQLLSDPALLKSLVSNIPLGRLGTTSDVVGVAAFLASDEANYITGITLFVDGGLTWNYSEQ